MADLEVITSRMGLGVFLVTVAAVLVGLVLGKYISKFLSDFGVPLAAGNPRPVTIPGGQPAPWRD
jgi:hypothetical protein